MPPLDLVELERELIDILSSQGLPVEEIRLIGLLGQGTRATVFSVQINGVYHVLKVYDSKESLRAELKNLRKVTPRERFLFSWQERLGDDRKINLAIIEIPEGQELNSGHLNDTRIESLVEQVNSLHRLRYRQRVSLASLRQRFERVRQPFMDHITLMGLSANQYDNLLASMEEMLEQQGDLFRVNKVRVHGDLWWPNVIVAGGGVYLIDWESVHRGDACEDIAKLRTTIYSPKVFATRSGSFWRDQADARQVGLLMAQLIELHQTTGDDTIAERLRLYLALDCVDLLSQRYTAGETQLEFDKASNLLLAHDALALFADPAAPPGFSHNSYFQTLSL